MPPNARDTLYHGLPPTVKSALRSKLQSFELKEEVRQAGVSNWLIAITMITQYESLCHAMHLNMILLMDAAYSSSDQS